MLKIIDNIQIDGNGCWVWQKSCSSSGYGQFTRKGKYWNTHRYVWQLNNGEIPKDKVVRHLCHNTKCCNIDHLALGTQSDNYNDSIQAHTKASESQRKIWVIGEHTYKTCRDAVKKTNITMNSIIKFTCPITRVFNIGAYREATKKAGWIPRI